MIYEKGEMRVDRLNLMIDVLRDVEAAHKPFDLSEWATNANLAGWGGQTPASVVGDLDQTCGAVFCAMGYAALDPRFQFQGLSLVVVEYGCDKGPVSTIAEFNEVTAGVDADGLVCLPKYRGLSGIFAAEYFFGIRGDSASALFIAESYPANATPSDVIERIGKLIELGDGPEFEAYLRETRAH